MDIRIKRNENDSFETERELDFSRGGRALVSVICEKSYNQAMLIRDAVSYLNKKASNQDMRVSKTEGPQTTIPVRVERGESARVRFIKFPVEILPKQ